MVLLTAHTDLSAAVRREWLRSGITLAEIGGRMGGLPEQNVSRLLRVDGGFDSRLSTAIKLANAVGYDLALVRRRAS